MVKGHGLVGSTTGFMRINTGHYRVLAILFMICHARRDLCTIYYPNRQKVALLDPHCGDLSSLELEKV